MLPQLNQTADNITMINTFMGLNRTQTVAEGEFSETKNVTNDYYPVLGNRKKRIIRTSLKNCKAMIGGEYISYVAQDEDDGKYYLYYSQQRVCEVSGDDDTNIIIMGAYVCVFPDGIVYNSATGEQTTIENKVTITGSVSFAPTTSEGASYSGIVVSSTAPSSPSDGTYWKDTSQTPAVLKVYSASYSMWQSVATAYTTISADGIGAGFKVYDAVAINGITDSTYYSSNTDQSGAYYILYAVTDNSITIAGTIDAATQTGLTVQRVKPELDYLCVMDNRIWGCAMSGTEIYACKQGDPTNWYCYAGLVSDSFTVSVGSQGEFTGCADYGGSVYFYKENGYHKLYGNKPSNYEMVFKSIRGVQLGSSKSIAHVGEYLLYKAKDAIVMYDGSQAVVSQKLGTDKYFDAVAGSYRDKYYICMHDTEQVYYLFVYDITKGTWIEEENIRVSFMANSNKNGLYLCMYPEGDGSNVMYAVNDEQLYVTEFPLCEYEDRSDMYKDLDAIFQYLFQNGLPTGKTIAEAATEFGYTESEMQTYVQTKKWYPADDFYPRYIKQEADLEDNVEWEFETGDIGMGSPYQKYVKRLILRIMLDTSADMTVKVMYDDSDEWVQLASYHATRKRSYEIPMQVRRCDHLRLKFSGNGDFKLYSIAKATEEGSGVSGNI